MDIKKILDKKLEEWFLVSAFITLIILVFSQVLFRYVINYSIVWTEELARYILIWIAWISASYAIREKQHIRIETIKKLLPVKGRIVVEVIVLVLWSVFSTFLAVEGMKIVLNIQAGGQGSPIMGIPMWIIYLVLPITGILMVIRILQQFFFVFSNQEKEGLK